MVHGCSSPYTIIRVTKTPAHWPNPRGNFPDWLSVMTPKGQTNTIQFVEFLRPGRMPLISCHFYTDVLEILGGSQKPSPFTAKMSHWRLSHQPWFGAVLTVTIEITRSSTNHLFVTSFSLLIEQIFTRSANNILLIQVSEVLTWGTGQDLNSRKETPAKWTKYPFLCNKWVVEFFFFFLAFCP